MRFPQEGSLFERGWQYDGDCGCMVKGHYYKHPNYGEKRMKVTPKYKRVDFYRKRGGQLYLRANLNELIARLDNKDLRI